MKNLTTPSPSAPCPMGSRWRWGCLMAMMLMAACTEQRHIPSSIFGQADDSTQPQGYDLPDIQAAGELIAATLSGPDTYYEYRGRGFGLQFSMAEAFARSAGTRLRMEMAPDTTRLLARLAGGEADLVALEMDSAQLREAIDKAPDSLHLHPQDFAILRPRWLVRASAQELADAVNAWWDEDSRQRFLAEEQARTAPARRIRRHIRPPMLSPHKGVICAYDAILQRHAAAIGWDWRLMAAQCYQESGFDPRALSWAGAQGLMQIMPATARHLGLQPGQVYDPEQNIAAAARYLSELEATFGDIGDRRERLSFVLAAYNGGAGHVRDAMTLAANAGRNPRRWADVDPYILALEKPRYYRDPAVRCGYLRGSETSEYVRQIHTRWAAYRGAAHAIAPPKQHVGGTQPSRVRPRSEFLLGDSAAVKKD